MIKSTVKILLFCVLQLAVSSQSLAANCLHPSDWEDDKCINDEEITCLAGFYNFMSEGGGYGLGDLTYDELVDFFCRPCEIHYYCPGDSKRYPCEHAEDRGMTECPTMSKHMRKIYNDLQSFRSYEIR